MKTSLVYRNIHVYRAVMNLLYAGGYRRRFRDVIQAIGPSARSVCDLCFGDTLVADWCRAHGIAWTGFDLNHSFVARAQGLGHHAIEGDLLSLDLPSADTYVMAGSLYHFHDRLPDLFDRVWSRSRRFIVSEPVRNLSAHDGLIGWSARRINDPGPGRTGFRFDEETLEAALRREQARHAFSITVVSVNRDMLVVMDRAAGAAGPAAAVC